MRVRKEEGRKIRPGSTWASTRCAVNGLGEIGPLLFPSFGFLYESMQAVAMRKLLLLSCSPCWRIKTQWNDRRGDVYNTQVAPCLIPSISFFFYYNGEPLPHLVTQSFVVAVVDVIQVQLVHVISLFPTKDKYHNPSVGRWPPCRMRINGSTPSMKRPHPTSPVCDNVVLISLCWLDIKRRPFACHNCSTRVETFFFSHKKTHSGFSD